jgi:hypothetical protein
MKMQKCSLQVFGPPPHTSGAICIAIALHLDSHGETDFKDVRSQGFIYRWLAPTEGQTSFDTKERRGRLGNIMFHFFSLPYLLRHCSPTSHMYYYVSLILSSLPSPPLLTHGHICIHNCLKAVAGSSICSQRDSCRPKVLYPASGRNCCPPSPPNPTPPPSAWAGARACASVCVCVGGGGEEHAELIDQSSSTLIN